MASERYFEILLSRSVPLVFGEDYSLIAHQLTLPSGRVDMLLEHSDGTKHIIEVKKDRAKVDAVDQVVRYVDDFKTNFEGQVTGWVVANSIPEQTEHYADQLGVRCLSVPTSSYPQIMAAAGIDEQDLLGQRIQAGILIGGGVQNFRKNAVPFEDAVKITPETVRSYLVDLKTEGKFELACGKMQIVVTYRGVKIGGFNRSHRKSFISSNIVLDAQDESVLAENNFTMIRKTQTNSSHVHVYWAIALDDTQAMDAALRHFAASIDRRLFSH